MGTTPRTLYANVSIKRFSYHSPGFTSGHVRPLTCLAVLLESFKHPVKISLSPVIIMLLRRDWWPTSTNACSLAAICIQLICYVSLSLFSGRFPPALLPEHLSLKLIFVQPPKWRVSLHQGVLLFSGTKVRYPTRIYLLLSRKLTSTNKRKGLGSFFF